MIARRSSVLIVRPIGPATRLIARLGLTRRRTATVQDLYSRPIGKSGPTATARGMGAEQPTHRPAA